MGFEDSSIRLYSFSRNKFFKSPNKNIWSQDIYQDQKYILFGGNKSPVYAVRLSFDSELILSCSLDGNVSLLSTEIESNLAVYKAHTAPIWDLSPCPYGHYFITGSGDHTARLWTTERKKNLREFCGHHSDVDCVLWHPNCHYILTGSNDLTIRLWDVVTAGYCVRLLSGFHKPVTSLTISPDGKFVVAGSKEGKIVTWDLAEAKILGVVNGHRASIWSITFPENNNKVLASGGGDGKINVWDYLNITSSESENILNHNEKLNDATTTPLLIWEIKKVSIHSLQFTARNLLIGAGTQVLKSSTYK